MKKILVLDELKSLGSIFIDLLLKDYEVEASTDATEIVPRVTRFRPDLVIVNTNLPHFDPVEVCQVVKKTLDIPIILLIDKEEEITFSIDDCTADDVLMKPVGKKELLTSVKNLIYAD
jgi:DNA-binding response OmpR family regulator